MIIGNFENITMLGNTVNCPKCGATAKVVDGVFNIDDEGLEILSAPKATYEIVNTLKGIRHQVQKGEITAEDAIEKVAEINPFLSSTMERYIVLGIPVLSVFLMIVGLYIQFQGAVSDDEFREKSLDLMRLQTEAFEQIQSGMDYKRAEQIQTSSGQKAKPVPIPTKSPVITKVPEESPRKISNRRKEVSKKSRQNLRERRKQFNPRVK